MNRYTKSSAIFVLIAAFAVSGAVAQDVEVLYDFVDAFQPERVSNAEQAGATNDERSGTIALPGLFVHPRGSDDAIVTYTAVEIPVTADPVFLFVRLGMRDGIPWDGGAANGVRFVLQIDDSVVLDEVRSVSRWTARAIDVSPWKGQSVSVAFHTNAIDGNTAYDWSVWGDPYLATIRHPEIPAAESPQENGILLLQLNAAQPVDVTVKVGERGTRIVMDPGVQWVPVHFARYEEPALQVNGGAVAEQQRIVAYHTPELRMLALEPSTPLAYLGQPFQIIATFRNIGRGTLLSREFALADFVHPGTLCALGDSAHETVALRELLRPHHMTTVRWNNLTIAQPGLYPLHGMGSIAVVVPPPPLPAERPVAVTTSVEPDHTTAIAANPWSRFVMIRGERAGTDYGIAEAWNGHDWQRLGTLAPWAFAVIRTDAAPAGERLSFRVRQTGAAPGVLYTVADAIDSLGRTWQLRCEIAPAAEAARIHLSYALASPVGAEILAFYGPSIAAGDKGFGIKKDFALFPGLEFLEADEESSSTRDLAFPLSERRVPAAYKIASPLMAVQGRWGLIGLLWDPHQEWARGQRYPAARFDVPAPESGHDTSNLALFAPSVGAFVRENTLVAADPYIVRAEGETLGLESWLILDHAANYATDSIVRGHHHSGLLLQAMQHYFEEFGVPAPSDPPREWEAQKALMRDGYHHAVWHSDYPGWSHCVDWPPGDYIGHTVPLMLDLRDAPPEAAAQASEERIAAVLDRTLANHGPGNLWSGAGCHIMLGEAPFYLGYVGDALTGFQQHANQRLEARDGGLWRWQPPNDQFATLGVPGDHTLGQAAAPSFHVLRAARFTGDRTLSNDALEAMKQMAAYNVPRGAQTWECPLYQPDILAAAQAIRAYTEAYRITGDSVHLEHARYWAWSGLPFLYTWELPEYPTMRYNVISVFGSTFYTHSWIGLPVVWCGLVYGYALQDLAEFDDSFPWRTVAEGITHSAMWQQYTEGPSRGAYPDSWNMVENAPKPADINPENIWVNALRLHGISPEIRFARLDGGAVLNSAADILDHSGAVARGRLEIALDAPVGTVAYSLIAPVPMPVSSTLPEVADDAALQDVEAGWHFYEPLQAVIIKTRHSGNPSRVVLQWDQAPEQQPPGG